MKLHIERLSDEFEEFILEKNIIGDDRKYLLELVSEACMNNLEACTLISSLQVHKN